VSFDFCCWSVGVVNIDPMAKSDEKSRIAIMVKDAIFVVLRFLNRVCMFLVRFVIVLTCFLYCVFEIKKY